MQRTRYVHDEHENHLFTAADALTVQICVDKSSLAVQVHSNNALWCADVSSMLYVYYT